MLDQQAPRRKRVRPPRSKSEEKIWASQDNDRVIVCFWEKKLGEHLWADAHHHLERNRVQPLKISINGKEIWYVVVKPSKIVYHSITKDVLRSGLAWLY